MSTNPKTVFIAGYRRALWDLQQQLKVLQKTATYGSMNTPPSPYIDPEILEERLITMLAESKDLEYGPIAG